MTKIIPEIPTTKIPMSELKNDIKYWGFFSKNEIEENIGKLLMMDIDLGRRCSLRCPSCFRKQNVVDEFYKGDLNYNEIIATIKDAIDLGLKTVKICGAGEPFENPTILRFLKDINKLGIGASIFTKGHVLGDDNLTKKYFAGYGMSNAISLCEELCKLKISILLSFQSFFQEIQDRVVGNIHGYTLKRNEALENLVSVGFNKSNPTRLALCTNPITRDNYDEIYEIYTYCRERNLYPIVAVLMTSGRQIDTNFLYEHDISDKEKVDLYVRIYSYNIEKGIQSLENLENEGISSMAGAHPCNQIACGIYLTMNGVVLRCPGDSQMIFGNIRKNGLKEIWESSENFRLRGNFNCKCPPKEGITLPYQFFSTVLKNLRSKYK